jgi:hypothetical protein
LQLAELREEVDYLRRVRVDLEEQVEGLVAELRKSEGRVSHLEQQKAHYLG